MGINSWAKGARGERELFKLLQDELGIVVKRNLVQTREGGADSISIPGFAVEVKRCEREEIEKWWAQTLHQAELLNARPILYFRRSRSPWKACIALHDLSPGIFTGLRKPGLLDFASSCQFIRAHL